MTQLIKAKRGEVTPQMLEVAAKEGLSPEEVRKGVEEGYIVIPFNIRHQGLKACGIGRGLTVKVNANLGVSKQASSLEKEIRKLKAALKIGADTVMDLSTGRERDRIRQEFVRVSEVPVGSVPVYQAAAEAEEKKGDILAMTEEDMFKAVEKHIQDGIDFITVHCGITRSSLAVLDKNPRLMGIVSRGGAITAAWMRKHGRENPFYENFDYLLELCLRYDTTLSLGDGLRPGSLADANDPAQIEEMVILGELVKRAREKGVQVMVEGPGHMPLNSIKACIDLEKKLCHNAPFYVLGPLVTDIAAGYDHVAGAIGGALAAFYGADFLCCVTPAEHLGLPDEEDIIEGVAVSRLAAHAADLARGKKRAWERDMAVSRARRELDWEKQIGLSLHPEKAFFIYKDKNPDACKGQPCSMCGEYCAVRMDKDSLSRLF